MKKYKWYSLGKTEHTKLEGRLRRKVKALYRFCKRHGIGFCDLYILSSDGSTTLNIRAKKKEEIVVNGYAFVK